MKKITCIIAVVVAALAMAMPANAQFRWGVKAGVNINSMHFDKTAVSDVVNSSNHTGFTGGLTCEFTVPIIGLGLDASLMYVHRVNNFEANGVSKDINGDYIQIPINVKYKFGLPIIGSLVTPYAFTGPAFSFLTSKKAVTEALTRKAVDTTWNIGLGVQLLKHVQIAASYGFGMSKTMELIAPVDVTSENKVDIGTNKGWTVTAAYLF